MEDLSASADGIIISLRRADADLSAVMHRLDSEFQHRFPMVVSTSMLLDLPLAMSLCRQTAGSATLGGFFAGQSLEHHTEAERTAGVSLNDYIVWLVHVNTMSRWAAL